MPPYMYARLRGDCHTRFVDEAVKCIFSHVSEICKMCETEASFALTFWSQKKI